MKVIGYTEKLEETDEQIAVLVTSDGLVWSRIEWQSTGNPKSDALITDIGFMKDLADDECSTFIEVATKWLVQKGVYATCQVNCQVI